MITRARRIVYLNLAQIALPVGALASILHRVSGVLLAVATPVVAWLLSRSLRSPEGFAQVAAWLGLPVVKALAVIFVWALAHHVLAGVRHLLSDIDVGSRLWYARRSAYFVNVGGIVIALAAAGALW
jgi:succinate dehydrogenase cytochrome b subunit